MTTQPTCADRIGDHLAGRLAHLNALDALADVNTSDALDEALLQSSVRDAFDEIADPGTPFEDVRERAIDALWQMPLAITPRTVYRIELSTGGPADWLEVQCNPADADDPGEVERITYHFADWFDHAERQLDGDEFEAARRFAEHVIPELYG